MMVNTNFGPSILGLSHHHGAELVAFVLASLPAGAAPETSGDTEVHAIGVPTNFSNEINDLKIPPKNGRVTFCPGTSQSDGRILATSDPAIPPKGRPRLVSY